MWKGLGLNVILVKSYYKYTRTGSEPLNSVGSNSTCIFECMCMHRIGDWILSITARPFQPSQGGFPLYPIFQSAKILLKSHPFSSDNFKKGWDIIKLIFFISHSAQTGKIHFFTCKYSMKKHNFPKKYSSKGTFSRNTQWCLSMSGWTGFMKSCFSIYDEPDVFHSKQSYCLFLHSKSHFYRIVAVLPNAKYTESCSFSIATLYEELLFCFL